ncbi:MAG: dTMP kinase [Candidatus Thermoplasmatota archaeon]
MAGRLIAFEGIDGSGKSSTLERVARALAKEGRDVVPTREETATERGEWVRKSIAGHWDPLTTTFLFLADRAEHVREMKGWLAAGKTVLCDRYLHSTYAYQGLTLQGHVPDPRKFLTGLHEGWCPLPDKVLLFKADPARCFERVRKRGQATNYEKVQFLEQVQAAYLDEARRDPSRFHVLDAERDIELVGRDALSIVRGWL